MSNEAIMDLGDLFQLEEEVKDESTETIETKSDEGAKEENAPSDQAEPKAEPADTAHPKGTDEKPKRTRRAAKQPADSGASETNHPGNAPEPAVVPEGWSENIIGKPKGRANPYFEGVVSREDVDGRQILAPFKDIKYAQRQIYVDDITLENPTVLATFYRIQGSFPDVIAHVTEEVFQECLVHPSLKKMRVNYSWVTDHIKPRRNYLVEHENRPTEEELKAQNKHMDEVEWAIKPSYEKDQLAKKDKEKYADMPVDEEVPPPAEEEPVVEEEWQEEEEREEN